MKKSLRQYIGLGIILAAFIFISGCTKYANLEDLEKLEAAKSAAISAESELKLKKSEHQQVKQELEMKKQELADAETEKATVKNRLEERGE